MPFATWDPDSQDGMEEGNGTKYSRFVEPVRVTLEEADMLYLPALWFVFSTPSLTYHVLHPNLLPCLHTLLLPH